MSLFLKSHLPLLLITFLQGSFIFSYYWFLGFQEMNHLLYVFIIQVLAMILYLTYRWLQDIKIYRWLQDEESTEFDGSSFGKSPLAEALYEKQHRVSKEYENKLHQVQADLNDRVTFINQWVHQMKTPLSVIHLMTQDEDEEIFQGIRKELYRIEDGLKTVLYSSRLSLFEKDYTIEKVPLQDFINKLIIENKRLFIQYKVSPKKFFPGETVYVYSDTKWLQFSVTQIISNAVKYSTNKSDTLEFRIDKQKTRILLEIKDFGVGIPSEDIRRVFEPYFTGANGRLYHESTGMGLYLVKEIMSKLQHAINLESTPGKGTTFQIYFSVQ